MGGGSARLVKHMCRHEPVGALRGSDNMIRKHPFRDWYAATFWHASANESAIRARMIFPLACVYSVPSLMLLCMPNFIGVRD